MSKTPGQKKWLERMAKIGLVAKGILYTTLGTLAFMAAFEIAGQSDNDANRKGVFNIIKRAPAGSVLLGLVAAGLVCYSAWRFVQALSTNERDNKKKWAKRLRYLFSGLTYASVAFTAFKILFHEAGNADKNQEMSAQAMNKAYGQWLLIGVALIFVATGVYQAWYGLAGKYKKHVQELDLRSNRASLLLRSGIIGYMSRGIVWLALAVIFARAAIHANAKEAGDTGKAFQFIEASVFGSYLLGGLGIGLIAYGVFNFIRARWEKIG